MAANENGKGTVETIAEEAKGLGIELYKDGAKPALAKLGQTVAVAVEVGLAPVDIILGATKAGLDKLKGAIQRKLVGVPPDRLISPPATIAAPAALHYALLGEGEEAAALREMFENLLMTSMDRTTAASSHPAFVTMIAQMTADEARILKSIDRRRYAATNLFHRNPEGFVLTQSTIGFRTLLGLGAPIDESRRQQYISNLERLGILRIDWAESVVPDSEREELNRRIDAEFPDGNLSGHGGSISVTALGQQFIETCVRPKC